MDSRQLLQFLPTMEMICEAFEPKGLDCRFVISDKNLHYRGVRVYHPGQSVQRDLLYLLNRFGRWRDRNAGRIVQQTVSQRRNPQSSPARTTTTPPD